MEDYKPNSYKSRERDEKKNMPDKRRTEKVVSGQVKMKKKNGVSKFLSLFIPEDVDDAKTYIIQDVVVPAAKDIIMDTISAFLGINNRYRSNKRSPGAKVNYTSYYAGNRDRDRRERERPRQPYDYEDVILESRNDAEDVLDSLYGMLDEYGAVSVNDFYDAVGCTSKNFTDARYGWTDLRAASVIRDREGYRIKLPKPMPLD